ncbi:disease resistance protein RPV1-like isoform X2 [Trifolium pratense]|uniref:disease resistance protein RPV1-like isoform X2 n=1 Tax=Trifolium pratense TaxID=57577 RepID=UPI001E6977A5|nr:disease resistance protein RPV1-like isoform X2 [Trifolium pratense]
MASSSSQDVTTVDLKNYDVFISFRGDDTRAGFTSHLYTALCGDHLHTYIDYRIQKGDEVWAELVKAIQDSTLFLVVFSENYATSTWCLNELVEIMECHKNGQIVVPVFYQVDPSHVRKQTGSYGSALAKHKKHGNNDDKMMQNWKNALFQVANLSGFHSTNYRTESALIEDITRVVLRKLNYNNTNDLTCNFISDENYWSIQALMKKIDSTEIQIIGLWGMGGIGKTTLAAAIFHKVSFQYEGSCFLENVTEVSKMHGINYTCNKLLSKLLKKDFDIDTSKVIPSMIIRRLKRMKSFIVLDDVNTLELLQNLIGVGQGWLGVGSTVIVTTRDKHVLISGGIEKIHQVKKMNSRNSLQLFRLNAFNKVLPKEVYEKLSERAIDYAKGNPLALIVLGSLLRDKSEIEWNCALAKLKEIPNGKIDKILRWSYNELDEKEKNIFLDIACILKGYKRDWVTKILNECGFFADIGIRHLVDKALIRVDSENYIQMHDLIQEVGKQIVREESPKNPGQRSRLCDPKEVCDVLKNNRGTEIVEAIFFDATEYANINLSPKAFENMVNLRLLVFRDHKEIKSVSLPHGLELLPENLRYFLWDGYPWKSLPPTFCAEMLVELSMQNSRVEKLWNGEMSLPNLETLNLTGSNKLIECPNVSGSPNLKLVTFNYCKSLPEVDSSIFFLQKLITLKVMGCTSLKSLSSNTCSPTLTELYAMECINLQEFSVTFTSFDRLRLGISEWGGNELPSSLLNKKNLDIFYFPIIECLVDLPENFADHIYLGSPTNCEHDLSISLHKVFSSPAFISVKHLYLTDIPTLSEIPDNIFLLKSLESLMLMDIAITSLPENIKYLPQLNQLNVRDCKKLQSIPALSQFIPFFIVLNCESLEKVSSSMSEACIKPNPCFTVLINCKKLDLHSYQTVLEDAIDGIELVARLKPANDEDDIIGYLLPDMPGREYWFHYRSTQVSFTLELPPNLLGFAYYFVLSQGHMKKSVNFGCECYLEYSSGERIYITSFTRSNSFIHELNYSPLLHLMSDHVVLWYDPVSCKKINEEIKAINDVNNTSYSSKLAFRFFIDENLHDGTLEDEVAIKECGFRWIYKEAAEFSTVFESQEEEEEEEERIHPRKTSLKLLKYWAHY